MGLGMRLKRDAIFLSGLFRTLARVRSIAPNSANLICDDLEAAMDRWPASQAIAFEGAALSYRELDALANRCAHWAQAQGLARGASVALFLPNRAEYLPLWFGLTKVGVTAALVNFQLTGTDLAHCLSLAGADHCIVDATTAPALAAASAALDRPVRAWSLDAPLNAPSHGESDLAAALAAQPAARPPRAVRAGMTAADTALFIYTSGTTGLPKAARVSHMRAQLYMRAFAAVTEARASDRLYLTLPLYHATGGLCAMGAALLNGASVALRAGFSASRFWQDVAAEEATLFVYIGELCRYLAAQPPSPLERAHKLRLAFGNGLGADVWPAMTGRFAIPRILEFYGSTEGNVSMFNYDGTPGAIGRCPPWLDALFNVALVSFDVEAEAPVRGPDGFCVKAPWGEVGECLGRIAPGVRTDFTGYVDRAASRQKVLADVFKKGDRWFRTGDLMTRDRDGCYYFVDRVGDTFRWKGENVSTTEVAQRLAAAPGVAEATVYGVKVPGQDGRAGMAALVAGPLFDIAAFAAHTATALAPFAQPVFVRLTPSLATTGTFKHRKVDLMTDGFDPAGIGQALYVRQPDGAYAPLTPELHAEITAGRRRV